MSDVKFEIKKDLGNIGGRKKLTYTSWNGNAPRFDVRDWYDNGNAGKGITFDKDELESLYGLLQNIFEKPAEEIVEETEEESEEAFENPWDKEEVAEPEPKDETLELLNAYPDDIQKKFDALDDLFKGLTTEKAYGKMPFADGDRLQYSVKKANFPDYEDTLTSLELKWFITDAGNLYIYTL